MRHAILFVVLATFCLSSSAQVKDDVEDLLSKLKGESKNLTKDSTVIRLLGKGERLLPILSRRFTDSTTSRVFSTCVDRYLTRGELALILADRIETMPYYTLTGMQNCTMESCDGNPNFIEYYLDFIKLRGLAATVQKRYDEWLKSAERKRF